jgi:hypothetical protein
MNKRTRFYQSVSPLRRFNTINYCSTKDSEFNQFADIRRIFVCSAKAYVNQFLVLTNAMYRNCVRGVEENNGNDIILTMNLIQFKSQSYRNISLEQLHSDRSTVSIVRSSAGRLLLEYLSARRLRAYGCPEYQNGALTCGF